jgi:redox-sensitive bicupin YhaK (pirin superfamily)
MHGPVTRLMSPSDLGQVVKPFVFLDLFEKDGPPFRFGLHPHSGIATVTYVVEGEVSYVDPDGTTGVIPGGGLEWMKAGRGMWHAGGAEDGRVRGFQLWIALPPELELSPYESRYVATAEIEGGGPARVLLGSLGAAKSKIKTDLPITYLGVKLAGGETWQYSPPAGHDVLWIAVAGGTLKAPDLIEAGEMVVFDRSQNAVTFEAKTDSDFVLGSSRLHAHDLALGNYSVHTSANALAQGERHLNELGAELRRQGRR